MGAVLRWKANSEGERKPVACVVMDALASIDSSGVEIAGHGKRAEASVSRRDLSRVKYFCEPSVSMNIAANVVLGPDCAC